jgi:signal transduction histidine kinase
MHTKRKSLKIGFVTGLVVLITVLHYSTIHGHLALHILHRELYFVPILLASFWFGLKFGFATALIVSLVYAPHVFVYDDPHSTLLTVVSQILVFNLVAVILGWLADRQRRQQKEILEAENLTLLGQAAVAIGYEMKDIVGALRQMAQQEKGLHCTEFDRDFEQEMGRLENFVDTLSSFASPERIEMLSTDLNNILSERIEHHQDSARKSEVKLEAHLDERGCPTLINAEMVGRVLDNLIKNAIEASDRGQTVIVRSYRSGLACRVEVQDQGPGISPEHLPKMFVPFFTTKENGTGLGLAACKKIMRDLGGDIQVTSKWGQGATFTLIVPREKLG